MCGVAAAVAVGSIVATGLQVVSQVRNASAQAAQQNNAATVEKQNNQMRADQRRREASLLRSRQEAEFGARGINGFYGTPVDLMSSSAGEYAREQEWDDIQTSNNVAGYKASADNIETASTIQTAGTLFDAGSRVVDRGFIVKN